MDSQVRILGDGDFPPELDRVNWSAYFWGPFWALAYSVWPWFWGLNALTFAAYVLMGNLIRFGLGNSSTFFIIAVTWMALSRGVEAVLGLNANRLLWERRSRASSRARPITVEDFTRSQRTWGRIGLAILVPGWVYGGMRDGVFSATDWAVIFVGSLALAALWGYGMLRDRRPAKLTSTSS